MSAHMLLVLAVTAVVFLGFIRERHPPEIVALIGTAVLILAGALPASLLLDVISNGAPLTIAAMFVLSGALEATGLIARVGAFTARLAGASWHRAMLLLLPPVIFLSAFANNTPVVMVLTPVVLALARRRGHAPSKYLIPLSYASILGGTCTLLGTSTNLIVDGIARREGLAPFGVFDITGVGALLALTGLAYLLIFGRWLLPDRATPSRMPPLTASALEIREWTTESRPPARQGAWRGPLAIVTLLFVVVLAALQVLPIVMLAVAGAAVVVFSGCLTFREARDAVHWRLLLLIYAMLAIGAALEQSGAMGLVVQWLGHSADTLGPFGILVLVYLVTSIATEFISNNAAAILFTPVAFGVATSLGLDPKPFVVAVMMAGSASFATPIGYQTNTFVYRAGGYRFTDFLRIGLPMNALALAVTVLVVPLVWPMQPGG